MKKKVFALTCSLSLMMSAFMVPSAFAAKGEILKAGTAPVIDGEIDDIWKDAKLYKMKNYIVAEKDNANLDPIKKPEDFSGQWRALWDDDNLYLLLEVTDDKRIGYNYLEHPSKSIQRDDCVLFYITPNSKTPYTTALWHAASKEMVGWYGYPDWEDYDLTKIKYKVVDVGTNYRVEAAIPWSIIGVTPKANTSLLFDVHAVDNDLAGIANSSNGVDGRYPQSKVTWHEAKTNDAWQDVSLLGQVSLRNTVVGGSDAAPAPSKPATPSPSTPSPSTPAPSKPAPSTPAPSTPAPANPETPVNPPAPSSPAPAANGKLSLYIDGVNKTSEAAPVLVNGSTLVPMRMIFETLGAKVDWTASTQTITATKGTTSMTLKIGDTTAKINNKENKLTVAPQLIDGRTMVPLRFVSEALGANVDWNAATSTVTIQSK